MDMRRSVREQFHSSTEGQPVHSNKIATIAKYGKVGYVGKEIDAAGKVSQNFVGFLAYLKKGVAFLHKTSQLYILTGKGLYETDAADGFLRLRRNFP